VSRDDRERSVAVVGVHQVAERVVGRDDQVERLPKFEEPHVSAQQADAWPASEADARESQQLWREIDRHQITREGRQLGGDPTAPGPQLQYPATSMRHGNGSPEAAIVTTDQVGVVKRRDLTIVRFDLSPAACLRLGHGRLRGLGRGVFHAGTRRKADATASASSAWNGTRRQASRRRSANRPPGPAQPCERALTANPAWWEILLTALIQEAVLVLTITRRATFAAAHRLYLPVWDDTHNTAVFGQCANPGGHGHNYMLEVTVGGDLDTETGMIADLKWVKEVMDRYVIDHVDHRNLNFDVEMFHDVVPTAENLARVFWQRLVGPISERARLIRVRVQETENNSATYEEP
jgi:6-pyruvoyltetrahydropterin/6-carboxytetrahydropterin synthase